MAIFLHRLVVAAFLSFSLQAASQASEQVKTLEQDYFDFFELNRETVFLHLNKTTLIPGEDLWLSAYIYNTKTELPNPETTNLRVGIYDEQGNHLRTHTVFVLGGKGSSTFPSTQNSSLPAPIILRPQPVIWRIFPKISPTFRPSPF